MRVLEIEPTCYRPARIILLRALIDEVVGVSGTRLMGRPAGEAIAARLRIRASDDACAAIIARAQPPAACGDDILAAPGRGPMVQFRPRRVEMTEAGPRSRHDGYLMREGARLADAFDWMTAQAAKAHGGRVRQAEAEGKAPPVFIPLFTTGQVEIGREYARLVERCAASGVKCSSLETLRASGSGGGDREAAIFRDFQRLRVMRYRIGDLPVKEVRRIRPGGVKRRAIRSLTLVDQVCCGGQTLSDVLRGHGWAKDGPTVIALHKGLCAALDRMRGYGLDVLKETA